MNNLARLFGTRGALARALDARPASSGYEMRPGQLAMAQAVQRTLESDGVLLCEAGTGTGKTLAYLVPALMSGRKVVISTATRALQEQIVNKDLPLAAGLVAEHVDVALMKGLSNYLCRRRFREFATSRESLRPKFASALGVLGDWVGQTETGDVSELAGLGEDHPIWAEVTSSSDTRVGAQCPHFEECFVTQMRREAERAQVIVVNHHLFFADLALRGPHPGRVLPDYDAVIFDEAHQLQSVASLFFGARVTARRVSRLNREATRIEARLRLDPTTIFEALNLRSAELWQALSTRVERTVGDGRVALTPDAWIGPLKERWIDLDAALEAVAAWAESSIGMLERRSEVPTAAELQLLETLGRRAQALRDQLAQIVEGAEGCVVWFDAVESSLSATPVDLSAVLRQRIFEEVPAVVLTSATLATPDPSGSGSKRARQPAHEPEDADAPARHPRLTGPFAYVRRQLGVGDDLAPAELVLDSPFDFATHALLYTPDDLPAPQSSSFVSAVAERVADLVELTRGGAFVLTTSLRSMRLLHQRLRDTLPHRPVLVQGEAPKGALIQRFRGRTDSVLVATQSFWEGVDVPGEALRLVVLEKIPFSVPSDPVVRARSLAIEQAGGNPFMDLFVPEAAISLKQGFGRLVRSSRDAGVVALLDSRIHQRGYAQRLLRALPPAGRASALPEVVRFVDQLRQRGLWTR